MKKTIFNLLVLGAMICAPVTTSAQELEFRGLKANARYDDGTTSKSEYLGWDEEAGKGIFKVDQGIWQLGCPVRCSEKQRLKSPVELLI